MYVNKKRRMCSVCGKGPESEGWSRRGGGRPERMRANGGDELAQGCHLPELLRIWCCADRSRTSFCMQIKYDYCTRTGNGCRLIALYIFRYIYIQLFRYIHTAWVRDGFDSCRA